MVGDNMESFFVALTFVGLLVIIKFWMLFAVKRELAEVKIGLLGLKGREHDLNDLKLWSHKMFTWITSRD